MKYKMVAVDMDGTLLDSQKKIAPATVSAIKRVIAKGVLFVIATGRSVRGVAKYQKILELPGPIITYNGALIMRGDTGEVLFERGLKPEDARRIFALGRQYDTTMCIWAGNRLYGNRLDERIAKYQELAGMEAILLTDIEEALAAGVTKILWYDEPPQIARFERELSEDMFDEVTFCTSQPTFLELFNSQVSKGAAIAQIGRLYGIDREEMIAVGDGLNDQSMLEYAGLGVAMANAHPQLKACAQYIADTNDNEGVRQLLEKFILA